MPMRQCSACKRVANRLHDASLQHTCGVLVVEVLFPCWARGCKELQRVSSTNRALQTAGTTPKPRSAAKFDQKSKHTASKVGFYPETQTP